MGLKAQSHINAVGIDIVCTLGGLVYEFVESVSFHSVFMQWRLKKRRRILRKQITRVQVKKVRFWKAIQAHKTRSINQKLDVLLEVVKSLDAKV